MLKPTTLVERTKAARKLRKKFTSYIKCKSCGIPARTVRFKSLNFSVDSSYSALCVDCYKDPEIKFEDILKFYTTRSNYKHEDFNDQEVNFMIDSLIEETKNNTFIKEKYIDYVARNRDNVLSKLFNIKF